jgi:hypothetical protein
MTQKQEWKDIFTALQAPFQDMEIEWRPQSAVQRQGDHHLLVLPYVQGHAIQKRLDDVLGVYWKDDYESITVQGKEAIRGYLSIKVGDEWITRTDAAELSDIESVKGGHTNAFKRVAVKFGIGRFLYNVEPQWVRLSNKRLDSSDIYVSGNFKVSGKPTFLKGYIQRPSITMEEKNGPKKNNVAKQNPQNATRSDKLSSALDIVKNTEKIINFNIDKFRKPLLEKATNQTISSLEKATEHQLREYFDVLQPVAMIAKAEKRFGYDRPTMLAYAQACFPEEIKQIENLFFLTDKSKAEEVIGMLRNNATVLNN